MSWPAVEAPSRFEQSHESFVRAVHLRIGNLMHGFETQQVWRGVRIACAVVLLSLGVFSVRACATEIIRAPDPAYLALSGGVAGIFDKERKPVFTAEYRFGWGGCGFHPWIGGSWATDGAIFVGGGALWSYRPLHRPWRFTLGFGPGYYERHEGVDLGTHLEFVSFAELGYTLRSRHVVSLKLSHVSNGGLSKWNPGVELLTIGFAISFR